MKAFAIWWVVGFAVGTLWSGDGVVGVFAGVLVWFATVQIWPRTPCRRCDGSPRVFDWSTTANWRPCPACEGRGWVPRLFAVGRS